MKKSFLLIVLLLGIMSIMSGCIVRISAITAPSEVTVEEEFVIAIDGALSGQGGGMVGLAVQVPESIEYLGGSYICSSARRPLRRNRNIEKLYRAEEDHFVLVLADSVQYTRENTDDIRAFLRFRATATGNYTLKLSAGASEENNGQLFWKIHDPPEIRDFAFNTEQRLAVTFSVSEPERNGTAAIAFSGNREYLTIPDTGLFAFSLKESFTIETWLNTTARDIVMFSTRKDDFMSYFPIELGINEYGAFTVAASFGDSLFQTKSRSFISDGRWHHVAVAYSADEHAYEVYTDGIFIEKLELPDDPIQGKHASPIIGARASKRKFFTGIIDELRFWSTARAQEEIMHYKNASLTGYENSIFAMYTFDKWNSGKIHNITSNEGLDAIAFNKPKLIASSAPIKIELLSFSVSVTGNEVLMHWEGFDESKVKKYEIERRTEEGKYIAIETIFPSPGENHQAYKYTDTWSEKTITYYRLRRISSDGSVLTSDEVPVGTEHILNFSLGDNEPNPFPASTNIPYTINENTYVTLRVYDLMGREIAELVSEKQSPGNYKVTFEGTGLPGGMYFYKIRTNAGSQTKKMYFSR